jgi:hypothetical protein
MPSTLEERVGALEHTVAAIVAGAGTRNQKKDWRSTVGMFEGDPIMLEIQEEGRKLREADRRNANGDIAS